MRMPTGHEILQSLFKLANDSYDFKDTLSKVNKLAIDHMKTSDQITMKQSIIFLGCFKQYCTEKEWMPFYNDLVHLAVNVDDLDISFSEVDNFVQ